jgi:hypothetical protein
MTSIVRFIAFVLIVLAVAWGLAIFTAWWIGMAVLTTLVIILAMNYLREIVENYIID